MSINVGLIAIYLHKYWITRFPIVDGSLYDAVMNNYTPDVVGIKMLYKNRLVG